MKKIPQLVNHLLFSGPITTALCLHFTARKVTIVGGVILGLGIVLTGLAPSLPITYITYGLITGLYGGSLYIACYKKEKLFCKVILKKRKKL